MMNRTLGVFLVLISFAVVAQAEIEKNSTPCDKEICFYWWPKLTPPKGWHQDQDASYEIEANTLVPDGFKFQNAETIVYAKALYKPRMPETKSLTQFISEDRQEFLFEKPDLILSETDQLTTANGKKLRSFTFFPKNKGEWEQVAYGEEGDFYLVFTISSHAKDGFDRSKSVFTELVSHYKE